MSIANFEKLPEEKRQTVINAALLCFGRDGYKKTAISEIAREAGISKASIFQYFGTKKDLYKYLYRYSCVEILANMTEGTEDFFDCLKAGALVKMRVMEKHHGMFDFLLSIVKEPDEALVEELRHVYGVEVERGIALLFANVDWSRFKPEYDRATVISMLTWITEGCIKENSEKMTRRQLSDEIDRYMAIMKKSLYREEYL